MADSIFGVPAARNPKKSSKINFARFLSSPSTPGPNLAPMDLCGIFGFSSPSTVGPYNIGVKRRREARFFSSSEELVLGREALLLRYYLSPP